MMAQGQARQAKQPAAGLYGAEGPNSLWSIAKKQLGDGTKYKEIARKNGIANPNRIYPGQVLKL